MSHDPYRARRPGRPLPERDPLDGRPLRVVALVHLYPPEHNAGAEVMLHALLVDLVARGWRAHVLATEYRGEPYERDGVTVERAPEDADVGESIAWADVVITHLDATRRAVAWCRRGRPLVHLVHNHAQLAVRKLTPRDVTLAVWNSEWIRQHHHDWPGPSIVVRPPVLAADYFTPRPDADRVTLLNLFAPKGAAVFWGLARKRPDLRFLAVKGAYGLQEVPAVVPANVEVLDHTPEVVAEVYRRTRVLLVPSHYESWGRVAVEAAASGIPIVASPTPGLLEALTLNDGKPAAIFAQPGIPSEWVAALERLDNRKQYDRWSIASLRRSVELDQQRTLDLDLFADQMERLARTPWRPSTLSMAAGPQTSSGPRRLPEVVRSP